MSIKDKILNDTCPICLNEFEEGASNFVLKCKHRYCFECIDELMKYTARNKILPKCPLCSKDIDSHVIEIRQSLEVHVNIDEAQSNRKTHVCLGLATLGLLGIYLFAFIYGGGIKLH